MASPTLQEPRWRRLPEERPRQIIEAALEVFGDKGLAGARLEDIAKRAGVSKGTIYLYFPNKEALFEEMIRETLVSTIEEAEREPSAGTPTEQLRAYLRRLWTYTRSPIFPTVHHLVHAEMHNFPDLVKFFVREVSMRSIRLAADVIRRGIATGEFRPVDPVVAARIMHALVVKHGEMCARPEFFSFVAQISDDEMLAQIEDFYLHAIRAEPAPATEAQA